MIHPSRWKAPSLPFFVICLLSASQLILLGSEPLPQKRVVADFEDVGTWRALDSVGVKPGIWFSGGIFLAGSPKEFFQGTHGGELRFAFDPKSKGPFKAEFERAKMSLVEGFLQAVEFHANSMNLPVSVGFILRDKDGKSFRVKPISLKGEGWKHYSIPLSVDSVSSWKNARPPLRLERIILESPVACEGKIYLDDVTLVGTFPRKDRLTITPVYEGIFQEPDKPVQLRYRIRSALPGEVPVKVHIDLLSFDGKNLATRKENVLIDSYGEKEVTLNFGELPIGAYEVTIRASHLRTEAVYDDSFVVMHPNMRRINTRPMWFGLQDTFLWNGEDENILHLEWLKTLGIDLVRMEITGGGRFDPAIPESLEPWKQLTEALAKANIDVCILYNYLPPHIAARGNTRGAAGDLEAFEKYAAEIGTFFGRFPNVKYIEFWNEPDIHFFEGTIEDYWLMFAAFSRGIRATAPQIRLTTGGSTVSHPKEKPGFNESLYSTHGDIYDVAAFHSHGPLGNYKRCQEMVENWQALGGISKPIGNTESGERSGYTARGRAGQARTLVQKMAYSKSLPNSEFHIWFLLQDFWDMSPKADDSFGIVTSDNRAKPAFAAYNEIIRRLSNTSPTPAKNLPQGVTGHAFRTDDSNYVLLCWASAGANGASLWFRSSDPVTHVNMFGLSETIPASMGAMLPIGADPLYLISSAPLDFLAPEEIPIEAPALIHRDATRESPFPVTVRNTSDFPGERSLIVLDSENRPLWNSGDFTLEANSTREFLVPIPASSDFNPLPRHYALEMHASSNTTKTVRLPFIVRDSYAITRDLPSPIILESAQDVHELTYDPSIRAWQNPNDLSVRAFVQRDDTSVLFRFEVTDDKHVQDHADHNLWQGDSAQVAFYNPANQAHTLFDLALRKDEAVAWCHENSNPSLKGRWDIPLRIRRDGTRTLYEADVPFAHLGLPDRINETMPVRFSFLVNEDDGQGRVRWMNWAGGLGVSTKIDDLGYGILRE